MIQRSEYSSGIELSNVMCYRAVASPSPSQSSKKCVSGVVVSNNSMRVRFSINLRMPLYRSHPELSIELCFDCIRSLLVELLTKYACRTHTKTTESQNSCCRNHFSQNFVWENLSPILIPQTYDHFDSTNRVIYVCMFNFGCRSMKREQDGEKRDRELVKTG